MSPVTKKNSKFSWRWISSELKRREVYPVIVAYAIVGWILLQIGEVTFEPLGLPDWAMTGLIILAIVGFPIVVILSWIFDITPSGLRRDVSSGDVAAGADDRPSVAVLPFADMSQGGDQAWFADGLAEDLIASLAALRIYPIISRNSSFSYKNRPDDARLAGRELGAHYVVTGSVRRSGDRIRVTAELEDALDGHQVWSGRYDREIHDMFEVQDEITSMIVNTLAGWVAGHGLRQFHAAETEKYPHVTFFLNGGKEEPEPGEDRFMAPSPRVAISSSCTILTNCCPGVRLSITSLPWARPFTAPVKSLTTL
mgnify:CR=1 FL=1